jgi:hypothetical protein
MQQKNEIQSLGSEIMNILNDNHLPINDFVLEIHFSTPVFSNISIEWQHYSEIQSNFSLQQINFLQLNNQIYSLLKTYNFELTLYGLIIGIPHQIFDAYIENFPEELTSIDVISKTGTQDNTISYYYALQRRKKIGT